MNNGPGIETNTDLPDSASYCVDCGIIMIFSSERDCPGCHLDDRVNDLEARIKELERQTDE